MILVADEVLLCRSKCVSIHPIASLGERGGREREREREREIERERELEKTLILIVALGPIGPI